MAHSFLKDPGSKVGVLLGNLYFRGGSRGYWNSELGTEKLKQLPRGGNIEPFPGVPGSQSRRACCEQPGLQTLPKASWLLRLLRFHRPLGWGALSSPHLPQGSPAAGLTCCRSLSIFFHCSWPSFEARWASSVRSCSCCSFCSTSSRSFSMPDVLRFSSCCRVTES